MCDSQLSDRETGQPEQAKAVWLEVKTVVQA